MSKVVVVAGLYIASVTAFLLPVNVHAASEATSNTSVSLIGTVTCLRCLGYPPVHKGYTSWTWAVHSVGEGDTIVLVVGRNIYKLQGDKDQILKFMERKATVTGTLDGQRLTVQTIVRPKKKK